MASMDNRELQELVEVPRERLDVEYKAWLDLDDRETRAKLARHLVCACQFWRRLLGVWHQ